MEPTRMFQTFGIIIYCLQFFITVLYCGAGVLASADAIATVVVECPMGDIQGVKKTDENTGQSYLSFKGIPYAKPPVGDLRFTKPQPHPKIVGTFNATKDDKIICPHSDKLTYGEQEFTEDCLILNIYAKDTHDRASSLRKVFVFIHGGGFRTGYSTFHDPTSFVVGQDVVAVTVNYRLGVLGFLSTENEASPGNYGLWDQTLAIKWVKDNIRAFGGDPDDVTIAGESAGGMSVGFQAISPHSKGLFTKVYAQSGTPTSNSALSVNAQKDALLVAKSTGCWDKSAYDDINTQESYKVMECLRKTTLAALTAFSGFSLIEVQFTPCVDGDFISDTPSKLLQDEEYLNSIGFYGRTYLAAINNNEAQSSQGYRQAIQTIVSMDPATPPEDKESAVNLYLARTENEFTKLRLGKAAASDKNITDVISRFYKRRFHGGSSFVEMITDVAFFIPSLDFLRAASKRDSCKSYFLYFDFYPQYMKGAHTGLPHGADLLYWFDMEMSSLENIIHAGMQGQMDGEDLRLREKFSSLIGEFVRSGNPGLALKDTLPCGWPRYDVSKSRYLNFNLRPWIGSFLDKDRQDLWFRTVPGLIGDARGTDGGGGCPGNGVTSLGACWDVVTGFILLMCAFVFKGRF